MVLVAPTKNMAIRPGQYISGEGRVYHPYLAGWKENVSEFFTSALNRRIFDPGFSNLSTRCSGS